MRLGLGGELEAAAAYVRLGDGGSALIPSAWRGSSEGDPGDVVDRDRRRIMIFSLRTMVIPDAGRSYGRTYLSRDIGAGLCQVSFSFPRSCLKVAM